MANILIVDDLTSIHELLETVIKPSGHQTTFEQDGTAALDRYKSEDYDVVLADISMQPMDGITMLKQLKEYDPKCVVIMMTGYASTETAIKALKLGAFDYIKKPFKVDELLETLKRGLDFRKLLLEKPEVLEGSSATSSTPSGSGTSSASTGGETLESILPGSSKTIDKVRQQINKFANNNSPVLLQGELGTGKRDLASYIHLTQWGEDHPFIVVECPQEGEKEFEEKLIGDGEGGEWIQNAKGGTLYLERLNDLSEEMQEKVVGILKIHSTNFRIICSSSVDLEEKVDEGLFNDELFYRIASFPVNIPPLREHLEDIPDMVKIFLRSAQNPKFKPNQLELSTEALDMLSRYSWPGNMAELRQMITSLGSSTSDRVIAKDQIPNRILDVGQWPDLETYLEGRKNHYIRSVHQACKGEKSRTLEILKIDEATLKAAIDSE